jgi:hypothetical protein
MASASLFAASSSALPQCPQTCVTNFTKLIKAVGCCSSAFAIVTYGVNSGLTDITLSMLLDLI